jgi:hypothetical protein
MPHCTKQNWEEPEALSFYHRAEFFPAASSKDQAMASIPRSLLLAASLMAAPMTNAIAQQNNPAGNMGSNNSVTASPGTADTTAASGMSTADVGSRSTTTSNYAGSEMNSTTPGSTGRTVVPGSASSQASSSSGTNEQKTGTTSGGGK